jgi:hypothetical protein
MAKHQREAPGTVELLAGIRRYIDEMDSTALAAAKGTAAELASHYVEVRAFYDLMGEINDYISKLKTRMSQEDLPKKFEEEGLTTLTLKGGYRVTISSLVRASTKDMDLGIGWMKKCECGHPPNVHDQGSPLGGCSVMIKMPSVAGIRRMRDTECPCEQYNAPNVALVKETINASTLAAFAKAELEEGRELPDDIFNVYIMPNTSVTKVGT